MIGIKAPNRMIIDLFLMGSVFGLDAYFEPLLPSQPAQLQNELRRSRLRAWDFVCDLFGHVIAYAEWLPASYVDQRVYGGADGND